VSLLKERLIRNFLFKKKFDANMLDARSMHLYKDVFKLDESFLAQVGPEKVDYDKRYMRKAPDKPEAKKVVEKSDIRKKMEEIINEDKHNLKTLFS